MAAVGVPSPDPGDFETHGVRMNPEEERAYRDGQVSERLRGHDEHLTRINGNIERTGNVLEEVARKTDRMHDQLTGILLVMPKIQTVAEKVADEAATAEKVADALRQKRIDEATAWDRWRGIVAWAIGTVIALVTVTNLCLRLAGIG